MCMHTCFPECILSDLVLAGGLGYLLYLPHLLQLAASCFAANNVFPIQVFTVSLYTHWLSIMEGKLWYSRTLKWNELF